MDIFSFYDLQILREPKLFLGVFCFLAFACWKPHLIYTMILWCLRESQKWIFKPLAALPNVLYIGTGYLYRRFCYRLNYKTWNQPIPRQLKPSRISVRFYVYVVEICSLLWMLLWIIYFIPPVSYTVIGIGTFAHYPIVRVLILILSVIFFLPQQRIFGDPVTRFFFRLGYFQKYEHAEKFAKFLSFSIMFLLYFGVW